MQLRFPTHRHSDTHRLSSRARLDDVQESAVLDATHRRYTHAYFGILEMAASCAPAANAACVVNKSEVVGSGKAGFATGGKPVVAARATRASARRVAPVTRAVVTPPQTHDNARPDTTLRPVSAAAVDSSKALEQFRSMGGASRELIAIPVSFVSARPRATATPRDDIGATRCRVPLDPSLGGCSRPSRASRPVARDPRNPKIFRVSGAGVTKYFSPSSASRGSPPSCRPSRRAPISILEPPAHRFPLPTPDPLDPPGYASEAKSSIVSIGLSIHTCPVEVREKMAVPEDKWEEAVAELCSYPHVEEAGILSTCNRMEIYVVALSPGTAASARLRSG